MVYQVKYDSVFRTFTGQVDRDDRHLIINGKKIRVYSESDASLIPWDDCGAEYIIESTGVYNTVEKASVHLHGGAKKVVLSAPSKDHVMPTFVDGRKPQKYYARTWMWSPTHPAPPTALAPMTKVINDTFGIKQAS